LASSPGPWGSLAPELPSHPPQLYEALLVCLAIGALGLLSGSPALRRQSGASLFAALGLWAVARFVAATTWRDTVAIGPFRVEQLPLVGVLIVAAFGVLLRARSAPPMGDGPIDAPGASQPEAAWPVPKCNACLHGVPEIVEPGRPPPDRFE
jgi:prolipoprotein diacylglyceryltransferase